MKKIIIASIVILMVVSISIIYWESSNEADKAIRRAYHMTAISQKTGIKYLGEIDCVRTPNIQFEVLKRANASKDGGVAITTGPVFVSEYLGMDIYEIGIYETIDGECVYNVYLYGLI